MKPMQSEAQKSMLKIHAALCRCVNAIVNPIRKLFDANTPAFEPKLRVVGGIVKGDDAA